MPPATSSRQRSSRCCDSSSTISCSRAGGGEATTAANGRVRPNQACSSPVTRRTASTKGFPSLPLLGQDAPPFSRHLVEPPTAFVGLLDPGALDPAPLLEAIEQGVERVDVKLQLATRPCLDQFAQVVAVPGTRVEQRQDEQFRGSPLQLAVERARVDI